MKLVVFFKVLPVWQSFYTHHNLLFTLIVVVAPMKQQSITDEFLLYWSLATVDQTDDGVVTTETITSESEYSLCNYVYTNVSTSHNNIYSKSRLTLMFGGLSFRAWWKSCAKKCLPFSVKNFSLAFISVFLILPMPS